MMNLPSQAYLHERLDYCPDTGALIWKPRAFFEPAKEWKRFNTRHAGKPASHPTGTGNRVRLSVSLDHKLYYAHRIIWKWVTGEDPGDEVDHENRIGTDNAWKNLRLATHAQNSQNMFGSRWKHLHLPAGVHPNNGKFCARLRIGGALTFLGNFNTPEEASAAYLDAKERAHPFFTPPQSSAGK